MYDAIALGELLIDFACISQDEDGYPTLAAHPGGAVTNFLAAISKFGGKTALIGKVGTDTFGELLKGTLEKIGIDARGIVSADDVFTTLAFVTFDAHGDRAFSFSRKPGADTRISIDEIDLSMIDDSKIFHFGTLSLTDEPAKEATVRCIGYAKAKGKLITFDPNLRKPLWRSLEDAKKQMEWGLAQADVVKISDDEVDFLWGLTPEQGAKKLLDDFGVKLAFVTCGAEGCFFQNKNACGKVSSLSGLKVIDTCGAGDIFGGSAVWKMLQTGKAPDELEKHELEDIVRFACTSAGLSTQRSGGASSIYSLEEIMKEL